MGTQSISLWTQTVNWCNSVWGILTFLIIAITANRMILTAIREKKGKESMFYRNSKLISGAFFLIVFVNCLNVVGRWIFGVCAQFKAPLSEALNSNIKERPVHATAIATIVLITIYVTLVSISQRILSVYLNFVATAIAIIGTIIIFPHAYHKVAPIVISVILLILLFAEILCIEDGLRYKMKAERKRLKRLAAMKEMENENEETVGITKKGILLAIVWIASIVAAYMAGEYSLVSKAVSYVQEHFKKGTKAEAGSDTDEELDNCLAVIGKIIP